VIRCRDVYRVAGDYLEHDLSLWQRWRINAHLRVCAACRNYLEQLRNTVAFLHRRPLDPPAPDYEDRLMANLTAAERAGVNGKKP